MWCGVAGLCWEVAGAVAMLSCIGVFYSCFHLQQTLVCCQGLDSSWRKCDLSCKGVPASGCAVDFKVGSFFILYCVGAAGQVPVKC